MSIKKDLRHLLASTEGRVYINKFSHVDRNTKSVKYDYVFEGDYPFLREKEVEVDELTISFKNTAIPGMATSKELKSRDIDGVCAEIIELTTQHLQQVCAEVEKRLRHDLLGGVPRPWGSGIREVSK